MDVRTATADDLDLLVSLVERLESELPRPPYRERPPEIERSEMERLVADGIALIAEEDGRRVGYVLARYGGEGPTTAYVSGLWVDPASRRRGIGRALLRRLGGEAVARGVAHVVLDVDSGNRQAIAFFEHVGFEEGAKTMRTGIERLLQEREPPAESMGALHVQSDDAPSVERRVTDFLPRLVRGASAQVEPGRAWTAVRLAPFDRDVLRRLGAELSHRFGVTVLLTLEEGAVVRFVIHDRGRMVDEYLSVPEYYGPLPPGDAAALRANPTLVSRLTGASPAHVRAAAQNGARPGDLPPADELYVQIAEALGLQP